MVAGGHHIYHQPNKIVCHCCGSLNNINHCLYECNVSTTPKNISISLNNKLGNNKRYSGIEQIIIVAIIRNEAKKYIQDLVKNKMGDILGRRGAMVAHTETKTEIIEFEITDQQSDGKFTLMPVEYDASGNLIRDKRVTDQDITELIKCDKCTVKLQQEDWIRIHQKAVKRLNKAAKSIEKPCRTSQLVPTDRFWRDSLAMCERMSSRWFSLLRTNEPILCKKQAGGQSFRGRTTTT